MKRSSRTFRFQKFLRELGPEKTVQVYQGRQAIYSQGDAADAAFYIQRGNVQVTVTSQAGKKAVIAILGRGDLFGTGCLGKESVRGSAATAILQATITRVDRGVLARMIHRDPAFAKLLISYLLSRTGCIADDLADQLFSSSEQRLARVLLRLAHFGEGRKPEPAISVISQDTLAQMVGTTRARISHFMNKFRKLGYISYNGGLSVHSSLQGIVLHDWQLPQEGAPNLAREVHY